MSGLRDCETCPGGEDCGEAKRQRRALQYQHWPACPGSVLRSSAWSYVVRLHNASQVAPLSGWPDSYAVWVVDAMTALDDAINEKRAKDAERAARGR